MLSSIYFIAMCAVGIALIAAAIDAVLAVSRRPRWDALRPSLIAVTTEERRTQDLPFVGTERREPVGAEVAAVGVERKAA